MGYRNRLHGQHVKPNTALRNFERFYDPSIGKGDYILVTATDLTDSPNHHFGVWKKWGKWRKMGGKKNGGRWGRIGKWEMGMGMGK